MGPEVSSVEGATSVQRVVCGGCHDFKIITKLPKAAFEAWEKAAFAPEADFLAALKAIPGISAVETQTYTLEEVKMSKKDCKKHQEKKEKEQAVKAMNSKSDPTEEERKGGSGHIGKMVFSAGVEQ